MITKEAIKFLEEQYKSLPNHQFNFTKPVIYMTKKQKEFYDKHLGTQNITKEYPEFKDNK